EVPSTRDACGAWRLYAASAITAAEGAEQQRSEEQHQEDVEQDLGDARGRCCDIGKAEKRRDQRDDEENQGPVQHGACLRRSCVHIANVARYVRFRGALLPRGNTEADTDWTLRLGRWGPYLSRTG